MINIAGMECAESPMEGALLCCTSISPEDRAQLAEFAQEMGAKHTLDLTSDVTHLLVGSTNSEKYQYVAKNREDVKVLLPEWVHAIRKKWMADEVIDLNAMDAEYRCPTLYGLKICITGFEDLDFRNELARNIAKHGGQYTGDLTKDVTHLIAFVPQGKKYEYAGAWGIKIVSLKWYKDTLDRGMQLDEFLYHPAMPPEDQGNGAWNRQPSGSSHLGKRQRPESVGQEPSRKLRRAASARFSSQHQDVWNDIAGHVASADSAIEANKLRSKKSAPDVREEPNVLVRSESDVAQPTRVVEQSDRDTNASMRSHQAGFLAGKHFAQKGFDEARKSLLFAALAGHGAELHHTISDLLANVEDDDNSRFLIVPHEIEPRRFAAVQKGLRNTAIVTELWLEYCMTVKAFVPPDSYALATPICPTEIAGVSKLSVNASGFHQVQTMHIAKTVNKLGAKYQETFTPETSVLVTSSNNPNQQKIVHATAWNVPVVTEKWLWKLIATNRIPSFEHFSIIKPDQVRRPQLSEPANATSQQIDDKAKSGSDHEDSFIEAAKAIEAREKQEEAADRKFAQKIEQKSFSADITPHQTARGERQRARDVQRPLQEMSANIISKAPRSAKKKLFRQFDGAHSDRAEDFHTTARGRASPEASVKGPTTVLFDDQEDAPPMFDDDGHAETTGSAEPLSAETRHENNSDLLKEFFEVKAAAEARKSAISSSDSKSKKKNLFGRAISNLSNSSRRSTEDNNHAIDPTRTKQPLSRASSINSINTDGLGVPLSNLSRIPSELVANNTTSSRRAPPPSLTGNAKAHLTRAATDSVLTNSHNPADPATTITNNDPETSFHFALAQLTTSQLPRPPSPTQLAQLTYADTDEAAKLKASLAEKRRTRARLGQDSADPAPEMSREEKERRMAELAREESDEMRQARWRAERQRGDGALIRDDERVVGVGRRTRGREKRVSALGGDDEEFGGFGEGDGVFERM